MDQNREKSVKPSVKKRIFLIIGITCFVAGLCLLLYPVMSKSINTMHSQSIVAEFKDRLNSIESDAEITDIAATSDEIQPVSTGASGSEYKKKAPSKEMLELLYKDLSDYNRDLIENGQGIADPFAYERPSFDLGKYGIDDLLFGYLEIPAINLSLPVYLGANSTTMYYGVGHISRTSIPLGGESTHAVIAGHRGMISKEMFDNIVFLETGDDIYFTSYWGTLHYKVSGTMVIDPVDTDKIKIQEGRDLLSLLTCHPYGYSTYRYVVTSERVKE